MTIFLFVVLVMMVYVFCGWATAAAFFAYFQKTFPELANKDYKRDLGFSIIFGALPPCWIATLIGSGFYRYGFDWKFRGQGGNEMIHAREDYTERIQDSAGLIPIEEPCFLIRGQDQIGHAAVRAWAHLYQLNGGSDPVYESAMRHADRMEAWAKLHGKIADLPVGVGGIK